MFYYNEEIDDEIVYLESKDGRLASTIRPENTEDLAFLDLKRHIIDDILAIVSLDELVNCYDWFGLSHINSFLLPSREKPRTVIVRFWDYYSTRNSISSVRF